MNSIFISAIFNLNFLLCQRGSGSTLHPCMPFSLSTRQNFVQWMNRVEYFAMWKFLVALENFEVDFWSGKKVQIKQWQWIWQQHSFRQSESTFGSNFMWKKQFIMIAIAQYVNCTVYSLFQSNIWNGHTFLQWDKNKVQTLNIQHTWITFSFRMAEYCILFRRAIEWTADAYMTIDTGIATMLCRAYSNRKWNKWIK